MPKRQKSMIPAWIQAELERRDLPHIRLGEVVGWNADLTSRSMNGKRKITGDELLVILRFFGYHVPIPDGGTEETPVQRLSRIASSTDESQLIALVNYLESLPRKRAE